MFPAGAGMNRRLAEGFLLLLYVPRRRGDEPVIRPRVRRLT